MEEDTKKWLYYGRSHRQAEQQASAPPAATQPQATPATEPPVRNLLDETPPPKPLPALNDSDPSLQESLGSVFGKGLDPFLVPKEIVRHTVVTIDNLPRKKTAVQMWPVKPIGGEVLAASEGESLTLNADNYARYDRLIKILQSADTAQVVTLYKQYYPLFQEAYVGLGYPNGYFNDRLVEVIDHLLATPDVTGPIELRRPSVNFEYVDPELESLSSGQKLLIRMGSANAAVVKGKLRELRQAIAKQAPAG
jgi:hypothetical protein